MNTKQDLWAYNCQHLWQPFTNMEAYASMEPIIIESGEGCWLKDITGKKYLDGYASLWANVHGHNHPQINDAIIAQINKISHSTLFGLSHLKSIELTKKLLQLFPDSLTRVHYSESGSTAVETALKIAYLYWFQFSDSTRSKRRFVALENGYHGETNGAKSVGAQTEFNKIVYGDLHFPVKYVRSPCCSDCDYVKNCEKQCVSELESVFQEYSKNIAAFIVEPVVQGAGGIKVAWEGYLQKVRKLCDYYKILLIADEVATGFGKTGKMFAFEHENICPDIVCLAKGFTGGYLPLAATVMKEDIYRGYMNRDSHLKVLPHGHTFSGNQLACAAAIANIEIFESENTLEKIQDKITYMLRKMQHIKALKYVKEVRQKGLMIGIDIHDGNKSIMENYKMVNDIIIYSRYNSLLIRQLGRVIVVMPPLVISLDEIDFLTDTLCKSIKTITENERK